MIMEIFADWFSAVWYMLYQFWPWMAAFFLMVFVVLSILEFNDSRDTGSHDNDRTENSDL